MVTYAFPNETSGGVAKASSINDKFDDISGALNAFPTENLSGPLHQSGIDYMLRFGKFLQGSFKTAAAGFDYSTVSSNIVYLKAGVIYIGGQRVSKSNPNIACSSDGWFYIHIDPSGNMGVVKVANGSTAPSHPGGGEQWLRCVKLTAGAKTYEYNLCPIAHDLGSVAGLVDYNTIAQMHPNYKKGVNLSWASATTLSVSAGQIVIRDRNDKSPIFCAKTSPITVATTDIDTGAIAANTIYYVYAVPDTTFNYKIVFSANATAPTNYAWARFIGWVRTNGSSQFMEMRYSDDGWAYYHNTGVTNFIAGAGVTSASSQWRSAIIDCSTSAKPFVPTRAELIMIGAYCSGAQPIMLKPKGMGASGFHVHNSVATNYVPNFVMPVGFSGTYPIMLYAAGAKVGIDMWVVAVKTPRTDTA